MTGWPYVKLLSNDDGLLVYALFTIPMDVVSKPRTTRSMAAWSTSNLDYVAWRRVFQEGIKSLLISEGIPTEKLPLFSGALEAEGTTKLNKAVSTAPFRVSGLITTHLAGDWDNKAKSVCDACNGLLWEDDRYTIGGEWPIVHAGSGDASLVFSIQYLPLLGRKDILVDDFKQHRAEEMESLRLYVPDRPKRRVREIAS